MALSCKYLLAIVETDAAFSVSDERKKKDVRWKGPHLPVLLRYVLSLRFHIHEKYTVLLMWAEVFARLYCKSGEKELLGRRREFLKMMESSLPVLGEFFAVPRPQQILSDTTLKRNEVLTAFINFMVEALETFLGQTYLSPFITALINFLLPELKFLLVILGAEVEETTKTNILAEIESIANQTGLFMHSFFFTARKVEDPEIAEAICDLLLEFSMTTEKIKQHFILPSFTTPTGDTQPARMVLSFKYILQIVEQKEMDGYRWKGPHFSVLLRYVLSLRLHIHERYTVLLMWVEELARLYCKSGEKELRDRRREFLKMMESFLPKLGELFAIPRPQQLLSDTTPKRNELIAAFINFLVEAVEAFLGQNFLPCDITCWIIALLEDLKILLVILGAEVEETKKTKILAEIELIANQTGLFVHSSFFTTNSIEDSVEAIYNLLLEFSMTKEKIKQHCKFPSFTTPTIEYNLLLKFSMTTEKIKQHSGLPRFTTRDTRRVRVAMSFKYLLDIVETESVFYNLYRERKKGGYRWKGPHFSVFLQYVLNLHFYVNHDRFSDLLRRVEESAYLYCKAENFLRSNFIHPGKPTSLRQSPSDLVKFLEKMDSFLPELRQFFTVPTPQQLLSDITPKRNELVAGFINFLLEVVQEIDHKGHSLYYYQRSQLMDKLKFIFFILGDTPFQCTEVEETNNILADIESMANQTGLFLHSFFFTTDRIKNRKIETALFDLFANFEVTKEKIEKHCIAFSNMPSVTTPNSTLLSVFIVDSVLDYLNHMKVYHIAKVKDQITALREELQLSRSLLGNIEVKQDLLKQAIQLRDLAYEAEYILTLYATRDLPTWYTTIRLSNFIQKNKLIMTAIQETKLNYGINSLELVESRRQPSSQISNSIQIHEEIIVGLNYETIQIASQLVRGPRHLQIISITGMPGLGKTTLAKKLYNHSSVVNYFDQRLWCVVSQTYQRKRLLRDILSSISKVKEDKFLEKEREDSELGEYLYKSLKWKRYLIVMDDTWDIQAWNDVKIYFPKDDTGSRVLVTTRNTHLASEASVESIINELRLYSADQCWDLLRQKVFRKSICPPKLEHIGKGIAANCRGLPLVVAGVAAVLTNTDMSETSWQQVLESLNSYISKNNDILELSYKHLPIHLKPCFLYFSAFREDEEIPVKKLLALWISEGFIPVNKDKRSEEIAEKYLIELINRNMVQVVKRRSDKGVKTCKVHDLMHDMALRIAHQEKILRVIEAGFSLYGQHHRLCNHSYSRYTKSRFFGPQIRSLFGIPMSSFNGSHVRLDRVFQSKKGTDYIGCGDNPLVQLRYLEIQDPHLQMPAGKFENLEFLIVTDLGALGAVKKVFSQLPKLRHLEFKRIPELFHENMKFSREHYCLETLSCFRLYDSIDEKFLRCFPNLRRLKCFCWTQCRDLSFLTQLESLSIEFPSFATINFGAMKITDNIKKLSLHGRFLKITSSIGKLPNLEILKLLYLDFKGENWTTNDNEFKKLKFLKLTSVELENWITSSEDHFPMLERLVLERCWCLKGIPLELGYIPTLQAIEVHSCGESIEESALKIQNRQQEECGNEEMQVIINGYTRRRR